MRKLLWLFLLCYAVAIVALWFGALAPAPAIEANAQPAQADELERLYTALRQQTRLQRDGRAEVTLAPPDLNRLATLALQQQTVPARARVELGDGAAQIDFSLQTELPRPWLNGSVTLAWQPEARQFRATAARVGTLALPAALLPPLERLALAGLRRHPAWNTLTQAFAAVEQLTITPSQLTARLALAPDLRSDLAGRQSELLFGPAVQQRALHYSALLTQQLAGDRHAALETVLSPLFAEARAAGADPLVDNRALLLAATIHSVPARVLRGFGGDQLVALARAQPLRLTLHGRRDLAQHFLVSALLASYGDEALASRAGLYKELQDMETSSGFDATDVLADYAGMLFGSLATRDAAALQQAMTAPLAATALMPVPTALTAAQREKLAAAAQTGDLDTLDAVAQRELLPLLLATPLLSRLPQVEAP